jgi:hypothetical protein
LPLVKHGVPFDLAFSMPRWRAMAFAVAIGEGDGGQFDWSSMKWRERGA